MKFGNKRDVRAYKWTSLETCCICAQILVHKNADDRRSMVKKRDRGMVISNVCFQEIILVVLGLLII